MGRLEGIEPSSVEPQPTVLPLNYSRHKIKWYPQEESNLYIQLRRLVFYPLNYRGSTLYFKFSFFYRENFDIFLLNVH